MDYPTDRAEDDRNSKFLSEIYLTRLLKTKVCFRLLLPMFQKFPPTVTAVLEASLLATLFFGEDYPSFTRLLLIVQFGDLPLLCLMHEILLKFKRVLYSYL